MTNLNQNQKAKIVLITGVASGIGYELARLFAKNNFSLILVDINEPKLSQVDRELQEEFDITIQTITQD